MTVREYKTAAAFKQALEQRLRTASLSGIDFARRRQLVAGAGFALVHWNRARRSGRSPRSCTIPRASRSRPQWKRGGSARSRP
jgi:hypothetical protein